MNEAERGTPELDRLRRREADAFTLLVNEHRPLVLALGQSLGFSGADLDDAAAEAFAAVYSALPQFEGRSQLRTWVYCIAQRTMTRYRRRMRSRPSRQLPEGQADLGQPSPGDRLQENEENERIWTAVARLGTREATVIELYYRQEWGVEEIAEAMECPVGTVKTLLFRARAKLREWLKAEEDAHERTRRA